MVDRGQNYGCISHKSAWRGGTLGVRFSKEEVMPFHKSLHKMPQVLVEPWWRGMAFRNWLNELLKSWKEIKSLGSGTYLTKKPDKRGKDGCSCMSIAWLSGNKLGLLTSTFIHFLCEKGRTVIYWEDGWEEICGKLESWKQPLWWISEGATFLLCCSMSAIPYTTLSWNMALAGRLLFLKWNMFEMFAEPVHQVGCIRLNCQKYIDVSICLLISAL